MIDFEDFFRQVTEWQEREFPEATLEDQYMKVIEEDKELDDEFTMAAYRKKACCAHETCDGIIARLGLLHKLGYGPEKIVEVFEKRRARK